MRERRALLEGVGCGGRRSWLDYESQQTRDSFDARRANVVVISDSGLGATQRERVLAALSSLPDRGAAVVIAGRK